MNGWVVQPKCCYVFPHKKLARRYFFVQRVQHICWRLIFFSIFSFTALVMEIATTWWLGGCMIDSHQKTFNTCHLGQQIFGTPRNVQQTASLCKFVNYFVKLVNSWGDRESVPVILCSFKLRKQYDDLPKKGIDIYWKSIFCKHLWGNINAVSSKSVQSHGFCEKSLSEQSTCFS